MHKFNSLLLIAMASALLAACGGGGGDITAGPVTVTVTVEPGAITCNQCTVTVGPAGAASAPAPGPAASAPAPPAPPPPAVTVPLGTRFTSAPIRARAGNLVWTAGGVTYGVAIVESALASFVFLYSAPEVGTNVTFTMPEQPLDDQLDLRPTPQTDAEIRTYLSSVILPPLNQWLASHVSVFANGYAFQPVSTAEVGVDLPKMDRLAARLAQWVQITVVNGVPVASLR